MGITFYPHRQRWYDIIPSSQANYCNNNTTLYTTIIFFFPLHSLDTTFECIYLLNIQNDYKKLCINGLLFPMFYNKQLFSLNVMYCGRTIKRTPFRHVSLGDSFDFIKILTQKWL